MHMHGARTCHNVAVRTSAETTGATGVAILDTIVNRDLGWILRRQDQAGTDYGIDAHIEVVDDDGTVTGRLLAVQVKAGPHYFRRRLGETFIQYVSAHHLRYWLGHSLPVLLVLVDLATETAYWHLVQEPIERTSGGGNLYVPARNWLRAEAKSELRSFTQTRAELVAERDALRQEAARLVHLLTPTMSAEAPRKRIAWEITEHELFWRSLEPIADTPDTASTISAVIAAIARDPFARPDVGSGVRVVRTRPYQQTAGVRLAYYVDADNRTVVLLHVEPYALEVDEGHKAD